MNIIDLDVCVVYEVFEVCRVVVEEINVEFNGLELIGFVFLWVFLEVGCFFEKKEEVVELLLVKLVIKYLGLNVFVFF